MRPKILVSQTAMPQSTYHMTAIEDKLVCLSIPFLNSYYSSILQCPLKRQ